MKKVVAKTLKVLADPDIGWVNRRDAAVELGQGAVEALRGLRAHLKDSDRDVVDSIKTALQDAGKAA